MVPRWPLQLSPELCGEKYTINNETEAIEAGLLMRAKQEAESRR